MSLDVALVSCRDLPEPDPDAAPLAAALEAAGLSSQVMAWDDESLDWSIPRLAVLRSCWNYPQHPAEFKAWAASTARATRLLNPLPIVEFSVHKRYLLALEAAGVPVAPTVLVEKGDTTPLLKIMEEQNWTRAVVKPAVSAASFRTLLVGESDEGLEAGESHLRDLAADRDTLVQAYLPSVEGYGERALVWVDGELTHAIRKTPRFDGQDEAVSQEAIPISTAEARLAEQVMSALDDQSLSGVDTTDLLYARIDMAPGPQDNPVVMELELIEPSLFFNQKPAALERFTAAIKRRLAG
jgi:glutathione synthase/RimK-type ligase-like ATP-grasp enzyme